MFPEKFVLHLINACSTGFQLYEKFVEYLNIKSYNDQIICNLAAGKTLDIDLIFN